MVESFLSPHFRRFILDCRGLTPAQQNVFLYLCDDWCRFDHSRGYMVHRIDSVAIETRLSKGTTSAAMKRLLELGYITRETNPDTKESSSVYQYAVTDKIFDEYKKYLKSS